MFKNESTAAYSLFTFKIISEILYKHKSGGKEQWRRTSDNLQYVSQQHKIIKEKHCWILCYFAT